MVIRSGSPAPQEQNSTGLAKLYFAYGSNLSTTQMKQRCPSSTALGLAYLPGWQFIISQRGYANLVKRDGPDLPAAQPPSPRDPDAGSFGVLYRLPPEDEAALDVCEGVPWAYQKVDLNTGVIPSAEEKPKGTAAAGAANHGKGPVELGVTDVVGEEETEVVVALVYIGHDKESTTPDQPKKEYVFRMNRAIDEAREQFGLPDWYIDSVMRTFIPPVNQ